MINYLGTPSPHDGVRLIRLNNNINSSSGRILCGTSWLSMEYEGDKEEFTLWSISRRDLRIYSLVHGETLAIEIAIELLEAHDVSSEGKELYGKN